MKVLRYPNLTVHDGVNRDGRPVPRCVPGSSGRYHVLPANLTTTCQRCLKVRQSKPYVHNRTLREESR